MDKKIATPMTVFFFLRLEESVGRLFREIEGETPDLIGTFSLLSREGKFFSVGRNVPKKGFSARFGAYLYLFSRGLGYSEVKASYFGERYGKEVPLTDKTLPPWMGKALTLYEIVREGGKNG